MGLGLIGGSVARAAVGGAGIGRVTAWTPSGAGPAAAAAHGIVPARRLEDAVDGADLVVLAAPPLACLDLLDRLAEPETRTLLGSRAVVTDVASTKAEIVARARKHRIRFVGGHPMAGREASGWASSDPSLLADRPWVVVPPAPEDAEAMARIDALISICGAHAVRLDAPAHDRAVASISHVPLVVSAALAEASTGPGWDVARTLVAGGWQSMTRVARGDPAMAAGIVATNRDPVRAGLARVRDTIDDWIRAIDGAGTVDAGTELESRFRAARRRLEDGGGHDGA